MSIEYRKSVRHKVRQPARLATVGGSILCTCVMFDVSATGAQLKGCGIDVPKEAVLVLSRDGTVRRRFQVVWHNEDCVGIKFLK